MENYLRSHWYRSRARTSPFQSHNTSTVMLTFTHIALTTSSRLAGGYSGEDIPFCILTELSHSVDSNSKFLPSNTQACMVLTAAGPIDTYHDNCPVVPLRNMTFAQWWLKHDLDYLSNESDIFSLPTGMADIARNKGGKSYFAS